MRSDAADIYRRDLAGYACELTALRRLLDDVDSLPLHAHKRHAVKEWISGHIKAVEREALEINK